MKITCTKTLVLLFVLIVQNQLLLAQQFSINGSLGLDTVPEYKLDVNGDGHFRGELLLDDELRLLRLASSDSLLKRLVYVDENGRMQRLDSLVTDLMLAIHSLNCLTVAGNDPTVFWNHEPGKIYAYSDLCDFTPDVGIGTNNPKAKLDVRGKTYFTGNMGVGVLNEGNSRLMIRTNQSNSGLLIQGSEIEGGELVHKDIFKVLGSGEVQIDRSGGGEWSYGIKLTAGHSNMKAISSRLNDGFGDRFTIFGDGHLKINSSETNIKLISIHNNTSTKDAFQVWSNGNVWATAVHVREFGHEDFPDYVFEPEYELLSFKDLRAFIRDNQRLPNMPSAEEVERNGFDLGEMNRLLVEKVEELTLYILELERRLDKVENE